MSVAATWAYRNSTGLAFTDWFIVDAHFRACLTPYRRAVDRAGIPPGARVLDAGCGTGSFLPWLTEHAGPTGEVVAVDAAAESVAAVRRRLAAHPLPAPVRAVHATVTALPVADASVDVVWCANTLQYLSDEVLTEALAEFRRVLRPGGTLAVKEIDVGAISVRPGPRFLIADFFRASAAAGDAYATQLLRSVDLYRWLRRAGFDEVRQESVLVEHFAPYPEAARDFYGATCAALARQAAAQRLDDEWRRFRDADDPANPLNAPDGYIAEGIVAVTGVAPPA